MTGQFIGQLILWLILAVIVIAIIYWVMQWLYRRSTKEVAFVRTGYDLEKVVAKVEGIADSLAEIFERADAELRPTSEVAYDLARERFMVKMAA